MCSSPPRCGPPAAQGPPLLLGFFSAPCTGASEAFSLKLLTFPHGSLASAATLSLSSRYVLLTWMNKHVSHTVYTLENLSSFEDFQDSPSRPPHRFVRSQRHTQVSVDVFLMMIASGCSTQKRLPWYPPLAVLRIVPCKLWYLYEWTVSRRVTSNICMELSEGEEMVGDKCRFYSWILLLLHCFRLSPAPRWLRVCWKN